MEYGTQPTVKKPPRTFTKL